MSRLLLLACSLVLFGMAANAQPTQEQINACHQDADRFCQDVMPDEQKVRRCLARHMSQLNSVCRSAFRKKKRRGH